MRISLGILIVYTLLTTGLILMFPLDDLAAHQEGSESSETSDTSDPSETPEDSKIENLSKEESLYVKQCAACHNWGGTGKGIFRPLIGVADKLDKEQILDIVKNGLEMLGMPSFPNLTGQDLELIYTYLSNLKPSDSKADKTDETDEKKVGTSNRKKPKDPLQLSALYWMNRPATQPVIEAYKIAWEIPDLLDELPCFCNCAPLGHNSLLKCYQTTHAMGCVLCRSEARRAARLNKDGKPNDFIAKDIVKRYWSKRGKPE